MYTGEDIDEAKRILKDSGYFVGNLWSLPDILDTYETEDGYEIDEETAYEILENAVTNDWIMEQIWETIDNLAIDKYNLKIKYYE